jgi:hypothetical protein
MKKLVAPIVAVAALALGSIVAFESGCMTQKVASVDPKTGATNFVTQVNQLNLALDCQGIQLLAAGAASTSLNLTKNNPKVLTALTDAHLALDGILHGASSNTTAQVVTMLKSANNPILTQQVISFEAALSKQEQALVQQYGTTVAGQISTAITQAIDNGIEIAIGVQTAVQ